MHCRILCSALVVMSVVVWSWDASCVHCESYCCDKSLIINIRLVASCWFLSLHPTFMMHGHKSLQFSLTLFSCRFKSWLFNCTNINLGLRINKFAYLAFCHLFLTNFRKISVYPNQKKLPSLWNDRCPAGSQRK